MYIKGLFLDYNGVILDDRILTFKSTHAVFDAYAPGVDLPSLDDWRACIGSNYMDYYRKFGLPDNVTAVQVNQARNKYIFEHWDEAVVRPYCADVVKNLRSMGIRTAIVSAETAPLLNRRVEETGLKDLFDKVYTDASPKKDHLVTALKEFGLKAEEVLFVEDSAEGIRAGNELGLLTVAFLNETSYGFHSHLQATQPKFRISELPGLISLVKIIEFVEEYFSTQDKR